MDSVIEELAKELKEKAIIGIIDVQERGLFIRYGVHGIPHFLTVRNGDIETQFSGGLPKDELRTRLLKYAVSRAAGGG